MLGSWKEADDEKSISSNFFSIYLTCQELLEVWKTDHEIPLLELGGHGRKSSQFID
jgi:hypothetical protein